MYPAPTTAVASSATIELDREPPIVPLPPDFVDALAEDGEAGWRFADLSCADQRRFALAIERARTAETRRRRIATTVETLSGLT